MSTENYDKVYQSKKTNLFIILGGIFLTNAILAEIIGVKIFSGEETLGLSAANWTFFGDYVLDFNLTAGAVIWPVVFLTTDIINEYYGKKGVRKISFITAGLIAYAFIVISLVTQLPPAPFWLEVNASDPSGTPFNINYAFNTIFRQGLGIIIGSLVAFLLGQLLDVFVFQKLRKITGSKMIWLRATGSTLVSQFIDSFVVLGIAFYVFGNWSIEQIIAVGIINYIYKFSVAILLTPLLYLGHGLIDRYLGKETAKKMTEEASGDSSFI
ncbi:queuosine precursor transporter [Cyclobacterium plantarum]|uniref:Probable queuosine precursor transporter n=1 Tax=Cyclobacterium plantarum TaxID=2716263 RepID=A0ABX0HBZ7_9BACT|nr:queuosine precursor transporter [Cyclobacterium plantarum]NHE57977.1 queuosine precursor transporter [Cyclobacterium plantarum]